MNLEEALYVMKEKEKAILLAERERRLKCEVNLKNPN